MASLEIKHIGAMDGQTTMGGNGRSPNNGTERGTPPLSHDLTQQVVWIAERLRFSLESKIVLERTQDVLNLIYSRYDLLRKRAGLLIPPEVERGFFKAIVDEILSFGPLEALLNDEDVTEIMVNGPHLVYVEKQGKIIGTDVKFADNDHVQRIINRIITNVLQTLMTGNCMPGARGGLSSA